MSNITQVCKDVFGVTSNTLTFRFRCNLAVYVTLFIHTNWHKLNVSLFCSHFLSCSLCTCFSDLSCTWYRTCFSFRIFRVKTSFLSQNSFLYRKYVQPWQHKFFPLYNRSWCPSYSQTYLTLPTRTLYLLELTHFLSLHLKSTSTWMKVRFVAIKISLASSSFQIHDSSPTLISGIASLIYPSGLFCI